MGNLPSPPADLTFLISAVKSITRGSKQWPVARGTSAPSTGCLHSTTRMLWRDLGELLSQGAGEDLVCDCYWKTHEVTNNLLPVGKLPSIPSVLSQLSQDPKLMNNWSLTQCSFYFSKTDLNITQPRLQNVSKAATSLILCLSTEI